MQQCHHVFYQIRRRPVVPTVVPGDHPLRSFAHSFAAACPGSTVDGLPTSSFADELRVVTRNPNAPVLSIGVFCSGSARTLAQLHDGDWNTRQQRAATRLLGRPRSQVFLLPTADPVLQISNVLIHR